MSSLITLLFIAILFNTDVYCISGMTSTDSIEEVNSTSTSNSSDATLEGHKVIHGPKTKTHALIESLPGESNQTDIPTARNDSLDNLLVPALFNNESRLNESFGIHWLNVSRHNESLDFEDDHAIEGHIDDEGCDTYLRNKHEDDCYENFQHEIEKATDIEDDIEKGRHICW